jgi:copper chaperone CopZ
VREAALFVSRDKNLYNKREGERTMKKLLKIEGMSCGHCVMHVQSALEDIPGVKSAKVDLLERQALVEGDALDDQALRAAVADAGYRVLQIIP